MPNSRDNLLVQLTRDPVRDEIPEDPTEDFIAHNLGSVVGFREPVPRLIDEGDLVPIIDSIPNACFVAHEHRQSDCSGRTLQEKWRRADATAGKAPCTRR